MQPIIKHNHLPRNAIRFLLLIMAGFVGSLCAGDQPEIPQWRGVVPGTAWWGADRFWRCRDTLVFNILDEEGRGFRLDALVRDMNIYRGGDAPVQLTLFGPSGTILFNTLLADEKKVNAFEFCDGIPDVYLDVRYREWHRVHSPGGVPPNKKRSPSLLQPAAVAARSVNIAAPAAGAGLYRLLVVGSMDNWISLTPSRPLKMGIHCGPGPMTLHPGQTDELWMYLPEDTQELGVAIHEEEAPFQWTLALSNADAQELGKIEPLARYNYTIVRTPGPGKAVRLQTRGKTPGAWLHVRGAPALFCPDRETAEALQGGLGKGTGGRRYAQGFQRVLLEWAMGLQPQQLRPAAQKLDGFAAGLPVENFPPQNRKKLTLAVVEQVLAAQNLDPAAAGYGEFTPEVIKPLLGQWADPGDFLAAVSALSHPQNPYFGDPALIRRVALYKIMHNLLRQTNYFWYDAGNDAPATFKPDEQIRGFWDAILRSNWYEMHDGSHAKCLRYLGESLRWAVPAEVRKAWFDSLTAWAVCRYNMRQGECTNQWAVGLKEMAEVWQSTREYTVFETLQHQVRTICTPAVLGRSNPDAYPETQKSQVRVGDTVVDTGRMGAGIMAEAYGHDSEYNLETEAHLAAIYRIYPAPEIAGWFREYYQLKTHLTLPRGANVPANTFTGTCCPTDLNARTRYYTHKSGVTDELKDLVPYGRLWTGTSQPDAKETWPCLEDGTFLRNIDQTYYFIKTPAYYAVVYGGAANPSFLNWSIPKRVGNSIELAGYDASGYGQYQRKSTKISGISALYATGQGPSWLAANHNVFYANTVWGRVKEPVCERWSETGIDPRIICSGFSQGVLTVDEAARSFVRTEQMEDAPLTVQRTTRFAGQEINVALTVTATSDFSAQSLYESIPVYADKRAVRIFKDTADKEGTPFEFAPVINAYGHNVKEHTQADVSGEDGSLLPVECAAFSVSGTDRAPASANHDTGQGKSMRVVFEAPQKLMQIRPVRYRAEAASTATFCVPLPTSWKSGASFTLRYQIRFE